MEEANFLDKMLDSLRAAIKNLWLSFFRVDYDESLISQGFFKLIM